MSGETGPAYDSSLVIPAREAEGLVRLIEAAPGVRRRYQFFVWMQSHVHLLLPHAVAVCGSYRRPLRDLAFEAFHSIVLDDATLAQFSGSCSPALAQITRHWVDHGGTPAVLALAALEGQSEPETAAIWRALQQVGLGHLLIHGVARPDRPSEIESLFVFAHGGLQPAPTRSYFLELVLPHLHAVYLRVQATEREMNLAPMRPQHTAQAVDADRWHVTERERQILYWVRQGKSNLQIGELLGISALTVKNHIQKILRKMGASNRAQAVSMAITANLLKTPKPGDGAG
jgi:transcriptional regulator EpsA